MEVIIVLLIYSNEWGGCKNAIMGDDCECQKFKPSSNDPLLCGYCDCHSHFHVRPTNDVPKLLPCQKKGEGEVLWLS